MTPSTASTAAQRVRLLVARDGRIRVERATLVGSPPVLRLAIAAEPVDSGNVWLYHKTTKRDVIRRGARAGTRARRRDSVESFRAGHGSHHRQCRS